jgi:hypothetical protein
VATINVLTQEAAEAILDESVVSFEINGSGHLIGTKHDGSTFDAGAFDTVISSLINTVLASATLNKILVSVTTASHVPITAKGMTGQSGDLQQWQNVGGSVLAKIDKDGKLTAAALVGTVIDGALNTMSNINAARVDGKKVTVNTTAPASPASGDIWINPSGA